MPTIHFEGASDDLVEVAGPCFYNGKVWPEGEEWGAWADHDLAKKIVLVDEHNNVRMRVYALYTDVACWTFAPGMVEEDQPLPDWPIRIVSGSLHGYGLALEVDVPEGVYAMTREDYDERNDQLAALGAHI